MSEIRPGDVEQLRILIRTGASANHPAFYGDFGELSPRAMSRLVAMRLVVRKRVRRYGGRVETGYWPTLAGRGRALAGNPA